MGESKVRKNPIIIKFIYSPYRKNRKSNVTPVEINPYWKETYEKMFKNW